MENLHINEQSAKNYTKCQIHDIKIHTCNECLGDVRIFWPEVGGGGSLCLLISMSSGCLLFRRFSILRSQRYGNISRTVLWDFEKIRSGTRRPNTLNKLRQLSKEQRYCSSTKAFFFYFVFCQNTPAVCFCQILPLRGETTDYIQFLLQSFDHESTAAPWHWFVGTTVTSSRSLQERGPACGRAQSMRDRRQYPNTTTRDGAS